MRFKSPSTNQDRLFLISHPVTAIQTYRWNWFLFPNEDEPAIEWAKAWCQKHCKQNWETSPATRHGYHDLYVFCFESPKEAQEAFTYLRMYLVNYEAEHDRYEATVIREGLRGPSLFDTTTD